MNVLIGFSTRKYNPLSFIVRKITGASCSHAFLMFKNSFYHDKIMIMEATEFGIREVDANWFFKRNLVVSVVQPKVEMIEVIRNSGPILGGMYDFLGLLGMPLVIAVAKWAHKKIKNPLQSPSGLFCSELVMKKMKEAKHPYTEDIGPSEISPEQIKVLTLNQGCLELQMPSSPKICFEKL